MKTPLKKLLVVPALLALIFTLNSPLATCHAQGTAFTYQGRLNDGGTPANGAYDLTFALFAANSGGAAIAGPVTNSAVVVSNGLFTVTLDFGDQFPGAGRWLALGVRTNGSAGGFTVLTPRQSITTTPYAVQSLKATTATLAASASSVAAANISGTIPLTQLPAVVVTNGARGVNITGTFTGDGAALTNIPLAGVNSYGTFTLVTNGLNFILSSSPAVGNYPQSIVVVTNVDGHGLMALISANTLANTLTVLTNNGLGIFGSNATLNVGSSPDSVVVADVNNDGKPDLISANYDDSTLTVLTNNGNGVFGANATLTVGSNPVFVTAADVNDDGKMDLICGYASTGGMTVLINNGNGTFLNINYANGPTLRSIAVADVNGDGVPDLIGAAPNNHSLIVFTNNGGGAFGSNATLNAGNDPLSVAVATNVDGHGLMGLISANLNGKTLTVLTNNGTGNFGFNATLNVGSNPAFVVAADVNGDGKPDLISASYDNDTLTVFVNDGHGGFMLAGALSVGSGPDSVAAADVNHDGKLDLISANAHKNTLTVLTNVVGRITTEMAAGGQSGGLRFSDSGGVMNVIDGSAANQVFMGVSGAVIGGGGSTVAANQVQADFGTIGGGVGNSIQSGSYYTTVSGGANNTASGIDATVSGGGNNTASADSATVGGGGNNTASGVGATVGGGASNTDSGYGGIISGGFQNTASGSQPTVGGGWNNTASGSRATVGGGDHNVASDDWSTVGGGDHNSASGYETTIGGGYYNIASADFATVSGGGTNQATNKWATVPGGVGNIAGGQSSFAAGGQAQALNDGTFVWADSQGSAFTSTANNQFLIRTAGGVGINNNQPGTALDVQGNGTASGGVSGYNEVIARFKNTRAGSHSAVAIDALPNQSSVLYFTEDGVPKWDLRHDRNQDNLEAFWHHDGAFSIPLTLTTNGNLSVLGTVSANGVLLTSDRNAKEHFTPVSSQTVLAKVAALPMAEWNYKTDAAGQKHLGPMAQDFHAAFGLNGSDDKHISVIDEGGVALAAIQGLNEKVESGKRKAENQMQKLEAENAALKQANDSLATRLARLEQLVSTKPGVGR